MSFINDVSNQLFNPTKCIPSNAYTANAECTVSTKSMTPLGSDIIDRWHLSELFTAGQII